MAFAIMLTMENKIKLKNILMLTIVALAIVGLSFGFSKLSDQINKKSTEASNKIVGLIQNQNTNDNPKSYTPANLNINSALTEKEKTDEEYLSTFLIKPIEKGAVRVPILLYHHIEDISPDASDSIKSYYVSPTIFERQMAWLAENNYQVIPLEKLVNYLQNRKNKPPARSVVITFDDGTIGQYKDAFPVLRYYNFPATFFVVTNWTDEATRKEKGGYMNWRQLKEMANNGMEIASHTVSHKTLGEASEEEIMAEILNSKNIIEEKISKPIFSIAYPGGSYNELARYYSAQYNYSAALSVDKDIDHTQADLYHLGRMHIDNDMPYFKARVEGRFFK